MRGVSRSTLRQHDGVQRWVGRAVMPAQGEPRARDVRNAPSPPLLEIEYRILPSLRLKSRRNTFAAISSDVASWALFGPRSAMSISRNVLPGSNGSASGLFLSLRSKRPGGLYTPDVQPLLDQHEPGHHHRSVPSDDRNVGNLPITWPYLLSSFENWLRSLGHFFGVICAFPVSIASRPPQTQ
jgi:hypothetical protein